MSADRYAKFFVAGFLLIALMATRIPPAPSAARAAPRFARSRLDRKNTPSQSKTVTLFV
ncbi:MAG: hypothetical protein J1E59_08065 [Treponema sp.]|nr:hypothetical protein [Treponema sp.]